jgi:predicted outer membrane repeat protein
MAIASCALFAANARIIEVPGDYAQVQAAIDAAEEGDEILVHPGLYGETLDFGGKAISVNSIDPEDPVVVETTIIDASDVECGRHCSVVEFSSGEGPGSILSGFTLTGGRGVDVRINGNLESTAGGGIYCSGTAPTISHCVIRDNVTFGNWEGYVSGGGGVYCGGGAPVLNDCVIRDNVSGKGGGGIRCTQDSSPTLSRCSITGNTAAEDGGGVGASHRSHVALLECSLLFNHAAEDGGACFEFFRSSLALTGCTLAGNSAAGRGGGIYGSTVIDLTGCTLAGNSAPRGGGIYANRASATTRSSILWDNGPDAIDYYGSVPVVDYSLLQGGWAGEGNINENPRFCDAICGDLADLSLAADSPCLGSGFGGADMGAWPQGCEVPRVPTPGVLEVPAEFATIQSALDAACAGDTILVAPGTYHGGPGAPRLLVPSMQLLLRSWDPLDPEVVAATVIDGRGEDVIAFAATSPRIAPRLSGFTIRGGGTGVVCEGAGPQIDHCVIEGNHGARYGGGIYAAYTHSLLVSHCIIRDNSVIEGGGGVGFHYDAVGTLRNCLILRNSAYTGSAVDVGVRTDVTITQCTLAENDGSHHAAVEQTFAQLLLSNSILWGNTPADLYHSGGGDPVVRYCDLVGGWEGPGNVDQDPLFVSFRGRDNLLAPDSPLIDAGDPAAHDGIWEGTPGWPAFYPNAIRSDMGAYGGPENGAWIRAD